MAVRLKGSTVLSCAVRLADFVLGTFMLVAGAKAREREEKRHRGPKVRGRVWPCVRPGRICQWGWCPWRGLCWALALGVR